MVETTGELSAHLTTGALVVYAIESAKKIGWIPLTADSTTLNRWANALAAAVMAWGVNWHYDGGTLVVTGLTLAGVGAGVWQWMTQLVIQQVLYDGVLAKEK